MICFQKEADLSTDNSSSGRESCVNTPQNNLLQLFVVLLFHEPLWPVLPLEDRAVSPGFRSMYLEFIVLLNVLLTGSSLALTQPECSLNRNGLLFT